MGIVMDNRLLFKEELRTAKRCIEKVLVPVKNLTVEQARNIVGTYRVAIEPNFIPWMLRAYQTVRSDKAKKVIGQNIHDEIAQDHPKMLRDFAQSCGVIVTEEHYRRASQPVLDMWDIFAKKNGIMDLTVAATLENTSLLFIPYLAKIGRKLGCKDFTYTDVHGVADIKHARDLYDGLVEEMGNSNCPVKEIVAAGDQTISFLTKILS